MQSLRDFLGDFLRDFLAGGDFLKEVSDHALEIIITDFKGCASMVS